jgi:starch synthase (maltosyl-transferring)
MTITIGQQQRAVIEDVQPEIDCGRFAIKRVVGEQVVVDATIFADGHDSLSCIVLYKHSEATCWQEAPMHALGNDQWQGAFPVSDIGPHRYTVRAWVDHFQSWHRDLHKRLEAKQDIGVDLLIGADLIEAAANRAQGDDARRLQQAVEHLRGYGEQQQKAELALDPQLYELMQRYPDTEFATTYHKELPLWVDRKRARFSAWYEVFPRSCSPEPGRHGTFRDCIARLPYIADMGFDIVYLPPIHPIGHAFRKGRNNATTARPGDVGSPWAIGSAEGGHKAIHPDLGTLEDFHALVEAARSHGMEIALDIAYQCSPDHPYVAEHPEWFRSRPDGTIQYAENPPKKYQDIYPINFETPQAAALWQELKSVMDYWIEQGVRVFRVDNPHTKSFYFWEWAIADIRQRHPDVIFLAEAFTRPSVMYNLAKLGFNQSYTYFTWRNSKWELTQYMQELTQPPVSDFFRPNFWPNTPDILHAYLQHGGLPAFKIRLILAATLTASYGIYGPAFELGQHVPREFGSEEYLDSEKYQIRTWDLEQPNNLNGLVARINKIRRDNPALHSNESLHFHPTDNEQIICYSKHTPDHRNRILVVVSLDAAFNQGGWIGPDLHVLGLDPHQPYTVHDLLSGSSFTWQTTGWNYAELRPGEIPAHIFRL